MEFLVELLLELFLEGGEEVCSDRKISKWIRYPIAFILILFYSVLIFGIMFLGISVLKENILIGLFCIIVPIVLLVGVILKFKKEYYAKKEE